VLYSQLMAKLDSENAISSDLETSKYFTPLQNILQCATLSTKYFIVLPPKEIQSSFEKR
jgi:hypothetical protein